MAFRVMPGMRASVSPRAGQTIKEMGRKDSDDKLILDVQPAYVVVQSNRTGNYSVLRRKTLWRYVITGVPNRGQNPIRVLIAHDTTGEQREWWMSDRQLRVVYLALAAATRVPEYMASRFDFAPRRRRKR